MGVLRDSQNSSIYILYIINNYSGRTCLSDHFDQAGFDASKSGTQRDLVFGLDKNLESHL